MLIPSREDDPGERVGFGDGHVVIVGGHGASLEVADENVYMAIALRNGGSGLAVLHGWRARDTEPFSTEVQAPALEDFRRQQRDLYVPAGDSGFWQGAVRERGDPSHDALCSAVRTGSGAVVDLLYGDHEGGQRTIARFRISPVQDGMPAQGDAPAPDDAPAPAGDGFRADVVRYWNVDREDPR
ncbi:MAG: hypothetical protein ACR2IP_08545 [Solirubrobacteraceae bacterium]